MTRSIDETPVIQLLLAVRRLLFGELGVALAGGEVDTHWPLIFATDRWSRPGIGGHRPDPQGGASAGSVLFIAPQLISGHSVLKCRLLSS